MLRISPTFLDLEFFSRSWKESIWVRVVSPMDPLPPGLLLRRVIYTNGRGLIIVIYWLQGRQWLRGLGQDGHWDQLQGRFQSDVGTSSS